MMFATNIDNRRNFVVLKMRYILLLLITAGCMYPPKTFEDKRLIIASGEVVNISELGMSIHNHGCGRQWTSGKNEPAIEEVFCDITVKTSDSTYHFSRKSKTLYIKNIKFEIDGMNPWGREEDSIPPGGCRMLVIKLPDTTR